MPSRERYSIGSWLGAALGLFLATPLAVAEVREAAGEWRRMAPLPEARTEVSVATDGERIFLAGGFLQAGERDATAPRTLFVYDPGDDRWEALTELPRGVNHAGFEYHDGRLYVIAGFDEASFTPTDAFHIYDIDADQWRQGPVVPTPRGALATAVLDGRIHAIGGTTHGREDVGVHEVYDPQSDLWSQLAAMPTPRNHHRAAAIDGRIVVLAGRDDSTFRLTTNEIYHPDDDRWEEGAPVPTGRSGVSATALDDWVYLFGGETFTPERRTFDEAERYHLEEDRWERLPAMPTARHGLDAAAVEGAIYVIAGGPEAGFAFSDLNERLIPDD
ncbi:Kelch repeat-containing protein [Halomonas sp. LBP4]|uniref:Kelch repeat-containing protein n=1 Tax=Halomonas sp. LBP4 TaxID=2044917 RepID=UPI0015E89CDC|nr:kelch repeat-containing protein [Halomonas sp. LBP4]